MIEMIRTEIIERWKKEEIQKEKNKEQKETMKVEEGKKERISNLSNNAHLNPM